MIIPPPPKPLMPTDTECYQNYWLCAFEDGEYFEMYDGHPLDIVRLAAKLRSIVAVTFNGNIYDMPIICLALQGATTQDLKRASDQIIVHGAKPWDVCRVFDWIDTIDLIEVKPGQGSLKAYAGKMHSKRLQDLPITPDAWIDEAQRAQLRDYCMNGDIPATRDLLNAMKAQLALRADMSAEYGIDLRSKSDAQIAEAAMRAVLGYKPQAPYIAPGTQFYYRPPEWLRFQNLKLLEMLEQNPFTVTASGGVQMTEVLENTVIRIGTSAYKMGIGGLHSMESTVAYRTDDQFEITDHDVASYYPSLILRTGIFPQQIGPRFAEIYEGWYKARLAAKRAGQKKKANSLKTLLNGTFGKLGNIWSIFYAPSEMIQVTVTGQLALLMLIEVLELNGVSVISANTDGIILRTPSALATRRAEVIKWWESVTGFETERTDYRLLAQADVNTYCAIQPDGTVKLKGRLAPPEPGPSGWPNPTGQVCIDAVVAYLKSGVPIEYTIMGCGDVRQFLHVRAVKGGGSWCPNGKLDPGTKVTQKFMRAAMEAATGDEKWRTADKGVLVEAYDVLAAANALESQYLGKVVRWYYARATKGCIVTPAGGQVAKAEGCKPLMTLPDALPADIDYAKYIADARAILAEIGVS